MITLLRTEKITAALGTVQDPDLKKDLVTLGMIKDLQVNALQVQFTLQLTTPACPLKEMLKKACIATSRTSPARTKKLKLSDTIAAYEKEVVRMLLHYSTMPIQDNIPLYEYLLCELQDVTFHTPACKAIFEQFKNRHKQKKATDADYFIRHGEETIKKFVIDLMAAPYAISDQWQERYQIYVTKEEDNVQQAAFENILRLKLRLIQQLIQENTQAFKKANEGEEDHFLKVHEVLKKSEMEIAQQLGMVITQ